MKLFKINFVLFVSIIIFKCDRSIAQSQVYTTPGTYTWTVPPCVTEITVQVWGGGGGGGSVWSRFNSVSGNGSNCEQGDEICATAGGGGGGGFASRTYTVVPGQVYNITVGSGGIASVNASGENRANNGANGGNSTFSGPATVGPGTLTGFGGSGGGAANIVRSCNFGCSFNHNGENGAGGTGGSGSNGTAAFNGGNGATGVHSSSTNDKSGGGGGGAGSSANGTNGGLIAAGTGGNGGGGNGGSGINQPYGNGFFGTNGNPGQAIGGGGGGAASHNRNSCNSSGNNHQSRVGGEGARGEVRITYNAGTQPAPLFDPIAPICAGDNLSQLPLTSLNGITGSWAPALNNLSTTIYTFTPDPSNCANTATLTITVNQPTTTPNFDQVAAVCSGATLQPLPTNSTNGVSGSWSPALNNLSTSTYTFTPNAGQCALTATMTITINSGNVPSFDPVGPYCIGASIPSLPTISNELISGIWSPSINNTATTTYTFTPSSGQCATTTQLTVSVGPPVTPTFAAISPVCIGSSVNPLPSTSQEGIAGGWSPVFDQNNSAVYTFTPNSDQCANTTTISVSVNPLTTPLFQQVPAICQGDPLSPLPTNSTNNISGLWNPPVNNSQTTIYTFTPNAGQCASTATMTINVNSLSDVPVFDPVPDVCQGANPPVLSSISINGIQGLWSPNVSTSNIGTATYTFTPSAGQCGTTATIDITVVSPIAPVFSQIAPLCQFTSPPVLGNLSNNGITGSWDTAVSSNASGNQVYTFTPSASQCATTVTMTIQVNSLPVINAGQDQVVCDGEQVILTASGASVYNWNNSVVNNVPFLPSLGSMTYTVTGTDLNGCTSTDNLIISVNPIPSVSAGDDVIICEGQQVILSASGASTYTWSDNILNGVVFTPNSGVYSYTVTGTNSFGCTSVDNLQLTVNDTPTALFQFNGLGCVPYTVELESISSGGNCFWELSNGETLSGCSVVTTLSNPGCYDVSLTVENNGCSASFTQNNALCAEDLPIAEFSYLPGQITTLDTEVEFSNYSQGANTYVWDFGDGNFSSDFNPSHEFPSENAGEYQVILIATSAAGCVDTAITIISISEELIFYVPNAFTPDEDSYNPVFLPVFTSGFDPQDYHLTIFNRWGEIVFESYDAEIGWNGTYGVGSEKQICQDGIYTWLIQYKLLKNDASAEVVGHVNLLR
jgi:gliding motility-associated-like protein